MNRFDVFQTTGVLDYFHGPVQTALNVLKVNRLKAIKKNPYKTLNLFCTIYNVFGKYLHVLL